MAKFDCDKEDRIWIAAYLLCFVIGIVYILGGIRLPYLGLLDHSAEWTVGIFWTTVSGIFIVAFLLSGFGLIRRELDPFFGLFAVLLSPFFLPGVVYLFGGLQFQMIGTPSNVYEWLFGVLWTIFWGLWVGAGLLCGLGIIGFGFSGSHNDDSLSQVPDETEVSEDEVQS